MYRALTGSLPFHGPTPMAVFTKHLAEAPLPPSRRAPGRQIPPGADKLVRRALETDPSARYQSVDELQAALGEETERATWPQSFLGRLREWGIELEPLPSGHWMVSTYGHGGLAGAEFLNAEEGRTRYAGEAWASQSSPCPRHRRGGVGAVRATAPRSCSSGRCPKTLPL